MYFANKNVKEKKGKMLQMAEKNGGKMYRYGKSFIHFLLYIVWCLMCHALHENAVKVNVKWTWIFLLLAFLILAGAKMPQDKFLMLCVHTHMHTSKLCIVFHTLPPEYNFFLCFYQVFFTHFVSLVWIAHFLARAHYWLLHSFVRFLPTGDGS